MLVLSFNNLTINPPSMTLSSFFLFIVSFPTSPTNPFSSLTYGYSHATPFGVRKTRDEGPENE